MKKCCAHKPFWSFRDWLVGGSPHWIKPLVRKLATELIHKIKRGDFKKTKTP